MKNKIGFHMNYFRGTACEYDLIGALKYIHSAGGQAIEVMPQHLYKLTENELAYFKDLIAQWDIDLICGAGRTPAVDASSPDISIREASYNESIKIMTLLHSLGGHKWDGLIHAAWPGSPEGLLTVEGKQEIILRCAEQMRRLLPIADELDIDLCFEAVNRFEHYLINTADEGLAFCKLLDSPRAKLLLDVFHMNIEENSIISAVGDTLAADKLGHFHISEANRCVPGTVQTHMDWGEIFYTLVRGGYTGSIILEPFLTTGVPFSSTSRIWRDLSNDASIEGFIDYVHTGIEFTRNELAGANTRCVQLPNKSAEVEK